MRIDKLLWYLRLAMTRGAAQVLVGEGHIRLNSRRIERPGTGVAAGDVLTLPLGSQAKVIEIVALPARRGPASEAQSCYRVLDERAANPIAADKASSTEGIPKP
jgi:ribosome-associated heat shock protein Hsp15